MYKKLIIIKAKHFNSLKNYIKCLNTQANVLDTVSTKPVEEKKSDTLTDTFGRRHTYLRISLTERCNLRCQYCMPPEGVPLNPKSKLLNSDEIVTLTKFFASEGVNKVRLTGGEPTLRHDLVDLVGRLNEIPGIDSVSMTTNGITLTRQLVPLMKAGLQGINISLDSLDKETYTRMSRRNGLAKTLAGIDLALQLGVHPLKVNCVVVKGENSDEILKFVDWTRDVPIEVRFIEFMPFSGNAWDHKAMMSCEEILKEIRKSYPDLERLQGHKSDTAKLYAAPGFKGRVGIISSMSDHFCGGCNRLRLTADGNLKVCLFGNSEVSLRDALRANISEDDLRATIQAAVTRKKKQHAGMENLPSMANRPMILIEPRIYKKPHRHHINSTLNITHLSSLLALHQTSQSQTVRLLSSFTHLDKSGNFTMVDVGDKNITSREAQAKCVVKLGPQLTTMLRDGVSLKKGNEALTVARLAGTMAAKKTSDLIPLCHQLQLRYVNVDMDLDCEKGEVIVTSHVKVDGKTGCEIEALTAVSVAALTLYDMCKAVNKAITITDVRLVMKSGGKSGEFHNV